MTEEQVTRSILQWLTESGYTIVCFDFPQSGTGRLLKPNGSTSKNKKSINPDIVAVKGETCLFFENKNRLFLKDFEKQNQLRTGSDYSDSIGALLQPYQISHIYYGIGLPVEKFTVRCVANQGLVDFIVGVDANQNVLVLHRKDEVPF